jgi:soluble lytic murein transglycosylase-like protein
MRSTHLAFLIVLWIFLFYPFESRCSDKHQLILLGTIGTGGSASRAIIKNRVTGKLKSYSQGDVIALADDEFATVTEISSCMVILRNNLRYETVECNNVPSERTFHAPSSLAGFDVIDETLGTGIKLREGVNHDNFQSEFENAIFSASEKYGVDPYLVKAVIKVESNFNPRAVSPKKAMGIMQLIPETASIYGVKDPFDPEDNIDGGVRHLRDLMEYFRGDLELVLAAYNAGKDAVVKYGYEIPPYPETKAYVQKVLAYYNRIKDITYLSWR